MKTKVSELTGEKLAEWTARAREWEKYDDICWHVNKEYKYSINDYRPDINGAQAMELQKEFGLSVRPHVVKNGVVKSWAADWVWPMAKRDGQVGETPEIAICRAVIDAVYGEYVEEDE